MTRGKHLLLLAVFLCLEGCQGKPKVYTTSQFKQFFVGDLLYLRCNISSDTAVKWYRNNTELQQKTNKTLKIAVATPKDSGSYQCESNGEKSDDFKINVLNYEPSASLTIKTGHPVMRTGTSVILELDYEGGLDGWSCRVSRGEIVKKIVFKKTSGTTVTFQPRRLDVHESIFWCTTKSQEKRSNQQVIWTTEKPISLEMYPHPAISGEDMTLRCLVWGTDKIRRVDFYNEGGVIETGSKVSNKIKAEEGKYKCEAIFTHVAYTAGPHDHEFSDLQDVFVHDAPIRAAWDGNSCSCPDCGEKIISSCYFKKNGETWTRVESMESGDYVCRAVMENMRSAPSKSYVYKGGSGNTTVTMIVIVTVIVLLTMGVALFLLGIMRRNAHQRRIDGAIYEDVQMKSLEEGDAKYEELRRTGAKEGEYDTLHTEAQGGKKKEGEYDVLNKDQIKDGVYHTLGAEGAAGGGDGGYEALKKDGKQEGVYHTLGAEGAAGGGDGAYEALKKDGKQEGVYHTLGKEGEAAGGGDGGYEALKKDGKQEGVYHTLGKEGEVGAGEDEALKKEGTKGDDHQTVEVKGAAAGEG